MEELIFIDKNNYGDGVWKNEPDRVSWIDQKSGYPCIILRQKYHGAFCGYVGVPENHPWFGTDYSDGPDEKTNVHGGLTFSDSCSEDKEQGVCHSGPEKRWWFGFDCIHIGDYAPMYSKNVDTMSHLFVTMVQEEPTHGTYRNVEYVKKECRKLAQQLKKFEE